MSDRTGISILLNGISNGIPPHKLIPGSEHTVIAQGIGVTVRINETGEVSEIIINDKDLLRESNKEQK